MSQSTTIEWTDRTWNPTRGCSRISPGCVNCYAEKIAARFSDGPLYSQSSDLDDPPEQTAPAQPFHLYADRKKSGSKWTGKVGLMEDKLREPLSWRKPCRCFVNSMSDLFHEDQPDEAIDQVFAVMALCPHITFQVLTKRADRMREWFTRETSPYFMPCTRVEAIARQTVQASRNLTSSDVQTEWPLPNVWLGVSVENQQYADERIPHLLAAPAAKRFVSYEPALGPLDFGSASARAPFWNLGPGGSWFEKKGRLGNAMSALDWIIVGGESGPGARPFDIAWARRTVQQCKAAGVAVFVKQLGARVIQDGERRIKRDKKGGDMHEWPHDLRVREFPGGPA